MAGLVGPSAPPQAVAPIGTLINDRSLNTLANCALGRLYDTEGRIARIERHLSTSLVQDAEPLPPNGDIQCTLALIDEVTRRNYERLERIQDVIGMLDECVEPSPVNNRVPR